mmetsp:Transcript_79240/g.191718  ORF Transcript_79240/g.191718 Transcript_79240/m.191718 type:complete len:233 (+) Transcript_79240:238-936(+)
MTSIIELLEMPRPSPGRESLGALGVIMASSDVLKKLMMSTEGCLSSETLLSSGVGSAASNFARNSCRLTGAGLTGIKAEDCMEFGKSGNASLSSAAMASSIETVASSIETVLESSMSAALTSSFSKLTSTSSFGGTGATGSSHGAQIGSSTAAAASSATLISRSGGAAATSVVCSGAGLCVSRGRAAASLASREATVTPGQTCPRRFCPHVWHLLRKLSPRFRRVSASLMRR